MIRSKLNSPRLLSQSPLPLHKNNCMLIERLFVVMRTIGDDLTEPKQADLYKEPWTVAVFSDLEEATKCYEENAYVVRNAPGEGSGDDMTIVTSCALYAIDTLDRGLAVTMIHEGQGLLLEGEEWLIDP
jgi:hypothetical protein